MLDNMPGVIKKGLIVVGVLFLAFIAFAIFSYSNANNNNVSHNALSKNQMPGGLPESGVNFSPIQGMKDEAMPSPNMTARSESSGSGAAEPSKDANATDKKVIKTGSLNLAVAKADASAEKIGEIAKANQGEVYSSDFYETSNGLKSGSMVIRVPYASFEKVFNEIKKVATQVISESTNAQDITQEYIDLDARLKNKKAEEKSFVELLNRSGKIEEILAVTQEVARVRTEIDQMEGQMRYLNSQTDMSTLTIYLSEDATIAPESNAWRPLQVAKSSIKMLIINGQNFIDGLISFLIVTLPMLLIWVLILWLLYITGRKIYRWMKNK